LIICSGTFGNVPFVDKARAAARAGFDGMSIYTREYEPGLRHVLDGLGLSIAEVDGAMGWLPGQPGPDPAEVLDMAAELGARSVTVLEVTGTVPNGAEDAFAALCERAAPRGLVMHIEPFPWSGIASLRAAAAIVRAAGAPNGGVLLDTWHLVRGPDAGVIDQDDVSTIVAVQISDTLDTPLADVRDEAMHHRLPPGPMTRRIIEQLPPVPLEVEIYSDEVHALLPNETAALAAAAYRALYGAP
jgi:sugar phosphate isomerase/epimerase